MDGIRNEPRSQPPRSQPRVDINFRQHQHRTSTWNKDNRKLFCGASGGAIIIAGMLCIFLGASTSAGLILCIAGGLVVFITGCISYNSRRQYRSMPPSHMNQSTVSPPAPISPQVSVTSCSSPTDTRQLGWNYQPPRYPPAVTSYSSPSNTGQLVDNYQQPPYPSAVTSYSSPSNTGQPIHNYQQPPYPSAVPSCSSPSNTGQPVYNYQQPPYPSAVPSCSSPSNTGQPVYNYQQPPSSAAAVISPSKEQEASGSMPSAPSLNANAYDHPPSYSDIYK